MRCSVKAIVKCGLIAEVITAIIGHVGEVALRYRAYSIAFDDLFGGSGDGVGLEIIDPSKVTVFHHHEYPPAGKNSKWTRMISTTTTPTPITIGASTTSVPQQNASGFSHFVDRLLGQSSNSLYESIFERHHHTKKLDYRPFAFCLVLVCLNILFIGGIIFDYLPIICPMTVVWLLYLILVLLVMYTGTNSPNDSTLNTMWSTLSPSPFTILVVAIILIFAIILIAMIVEERRQIAMRIRAKSAAIPLVKSRDMDLDEI